MIVRTGLKRQEPELAEKMRDYGRKCDAAYLKLADNLLDIKRVGPVKSYLRATGGYNPDRLDILGGPWQDRKDYAGFACCSMGGPDAASPKRCATVTTRPCSIRPRCT